MSNNKPKSGSVSLFPILFPVGKPGKPFVFVPVENTLNNHPDYQNTAEMYLTY